MSIARKVLCLTIAALLVACVFYFFRQPSPQAHSGQEPPAIPAANTPPTEIELVAIGDLLMHLPVVNSTYDAATGRYEFDNLFDEVRPLLTGADYAVANLETCLAGKAKGYQGYPLFNTPDDFAPAIANLGIDLVTTANNHSMDMGFDGLVATLDCLDRNGLAHIGTYRTIKEREKPFVAEVKGVRLGFVNFTATTNGLPLPPERPFCVGLLNDEQVTRDLAELRRKNPDLIIACVHFGTEYQRYADTFQEKWVHKLFELGVDAVIGCHPHVVQPMIWRNVELSSTKKRCFAAYSLGNFISNQRWRYSDSGIVLHLKIFKYPEGTASIVSASYTPVWVDTYHIAGRKHYRVLPVSKAIEDYEHSRDGLLTVEDYNRLLEVRDELSELLDDPVQGIGPHPLDM